LIKNIFNRKLTVNSHRTENIKLKIGRKYFESPSLFNILGARHRGHNGQIKPFLRDFVDAVLVRLGKAPLKIVPAINRHNQFKVLFFL